MSYNNNGYKPYLRKRYEANVSPSVRVFAQKHGIDLSNIPSNEHGNITMKMLKEYVRNQEVD